MIYYIRTADRLILLTIYAKTKQTDISVEEIRRIIDEVENSEDTPQSHEISVSSS